MNDATGENYSDDIVCTLEEDAGSEGRYLLTMTADRGYLSSEDTAYPVTIDPSYTWCGDGEFTDVYVSGAYPDYNFYAPGTTGMYTGKTASHGVRRTYLTFSGITPRILDKSVAEAVLSVYEISGGTSGEEVEARCVKAAWTPSALTWNSRPGIYATLTGSRTARTLTPCARTKKATLPLPSRQMPLPAFMTSRMQGMFTIPIQEG